MTLSSASGPAPADGSRRQFTALLVLSGLGGLSACGGGSGGDAVVPSPAPAPSPTPAPPAPAPNLDPGLHHVAGGLGGPGFLAGQGSADTRLPSFMSAMATHPVTGEVWFVGGRTTNTRPALYMGGMGRISSTGELNYVEPLNGLGSGNVGVFDGLNRYLGASSLPGFTSAKVYRMDTAPPVLLAGTGSFVRPRDGQGASAVLMAFGTPVRGPKSLIYFLDGYNDEAWVRSLSVDGVVTTLARLPNLGSGRLVNGPNGTVRLCMPGATANQQDWFELIEPAAGQWTWFAIGSNWPANLAPVAASLADVDTYWAVEYRNNPAQMVLQLRHLNGTLLRTWTRPYLASSMAVDGRTGHLLVAQVDSSNSALSEAWIDRLDPTRDDTVASPGLRSQAANVDGTGTQARFEFLSTVSATTDAASGQLHIHTPLGLRTFNPASAAVTTLSTARVSFAHRLVRQASGDFVMSDGSSSLYRMSQGQTTEAWKKWTDIPAGSGNATFVTALQQDRLGQLWFATGFDGALGAYPSVRQSSMLGTVGANGAVQVLFGDPNLGHTLEDYPAPEQRPWYFDIVDLGFQGDAASGTSVCWVLRNRSTYHPRSNSRDRTDNVLVRLENGAPHSFALTPPGTQVFHSLCTLPSHPDEVFLASAGAVYRWSEAAGLRLMAGRADGLPTGVRPGALPASLNDVSFISPGPTAHSLYIGSENSVLRLELPA